MSIYDILETEKVMLSSELVKKMEIEENITNEAARKRVQRLNSHYSKLKGFFSENQSLIYHKSLYKKDKFYEIFIESLRLKGKSYYSIINAIILHSGFISKDSFSNYTFVPKKNLKSHINFNSALKKLIEYNIIIEHDEKTYRFPLFIENILDVKNNYQRYKAIELSKKVILQNFEAILKNTNFISYNKGKQNNEFAKFSWGFTAPTYLKGLSTYKNEKIQEGFLVVDIILNRKLKKEDVEFFTRKIDVVSNTHKKINFLPVLIIDSIEDYSSLKNKGVWIITIDKFFGKDFLEMIYSLIEVVTNASAVLIKEPDKFIRLMNNLEKLVGGGTNNLKGDLFELAVGYYYRHYCQYICIGKNIEYIDNEDKVIKKEIDVWAEYDNEIKIIECKGLKSKLDLKYIETYLNKNIPIIYKWCKQEFQNFRDKKIIFEIWSTGGFDEDALKLLNERKSSVKKYDLEFYDIKQIKEKASKLRNNKFKEIIKKYYSNELL